MPLKVVTCNITQHHINETLSPVEKPMLAPTMLEQPLL